MVVLREISGPNRHLVAIKFRPIDIGIRSLFEKVVYKDHAALLPSNSRTNA